MLVSYWAVLLVLAGGLAVSHARSPRPSGRSKWVVGGAVAGAGALAALWPAATVPAAVVLTGAGVYVLLYRELTSPDDRPEVRG